MKNSYDADVEGTDFDDFEKTTRLVNEWCSERTNGKIDEIEKALLENIKAKSRNFPTLLEELL